MTERIRAASEVCNHRVSLNSRICNVSSGVKRDAGAAELPDEDEQGGKFQQVEGLTTVDAEEIPCEFSMDDELRGRRDRRRC